jgi:cytochrome oxidase Cu insertion factor (SCO1/SenC/PrrC family)
MTNSPKSLLLIIAGLFLIPVALAWMAFSGAVNLNPESRINRGILIDPVIPLNWPADVRPSLEGRWVLAYPLKENCYTSCQSELAGLRGLHLALGRKQIHVQILLIVPALQAGTETREWPGKRELLAIYPKFEIITDPGQTIGVLLTRAGYRVSDSDQNAGSGTYLIDPYGNIMMYYSRGTDQTDIKADLERLLKYT